MKYTAIVIAALAAASGAFCEDPGDSRPRRESPDPSYEPMRGTSAGRGRSRPVEKAPAPVVEAPPVERNYPVQPRVEVQAPAGPRVKYIIDGRPVYEGEPDVPGIDLKKNGSSTKNGGNSGARNATQSVEIIADPVYTPPVQTAPATPSGPRIKYILDGKPVYEGEEPVNGAAVVQRDSTGAQPAARQPAAILEDDVTADKPGTAAAAERNVSLLDEYVGGEHLNSRAERCYKLMATLKTNVETVSRCLDNRGKENARLMHTADEVSKNITDLADIWPGSTDFILRCTTTKRYSLLFNEELSRTPWKWAQVRWSFDAFLKDVRVFREYAKAMADAELKQQPRRLKDGTYAHTKTGELIYEDVPDPVADQLAARQEAKIKADREQLAKIRRGVEARTDAEKNKLETDLRNAR